MPLFNGMKIGTNGLGEVTGEQILYGDNKAEKTEKQFFLRSVRENGTKSRLLSREL